MTTPRSVPYRRNALFRGVAPELLRAARITPRPVWVEAGERIFDEGDPPDYCYLVGRGAVSITKALPDGSDELLATIGAGDFFGELALYDATARSARATAAVRTRLGRLDQENFERLRRLAPLAISSTLAERTIERVRRTNAHLVAELAAAGRLSRVGTELGVLSHNLRSPLATIRNAADILGEWLDESTTERGDVLRFVEMIRTTADRALTQIDVLMARVRGEIGEEAALLSAGEILRELREVTAGFVGPDVRYRDDHTAFDGRLYADRGELVAALANLVKNAVEALPAEGGDVVVSVAAEGRWAVFSVSDSGSGIAYEHLPLIFERRFTHGKAGGSGIGLAHVRAVAEKHGGSVEVESEPGRGTTFRVRLPALP